MSLWSSNTSLKTIAPESRGSPKFSPFIPSIANISRFSETTTVTALTLLCPVVHYEDAPNLCTISLQRSVVSSKHINAFVGVSEFKNFFPQRKSWTWLSTAIIARSFWIKMTLFSGNALINVLNGIRLFSLFSTYTVLQPKCIDVRAFDYSG